MLFLDPEVVNVIFLPFLFTFLQNVRSQPADSPVTSYCGQGDKVGLPRQKALLGTGDLAQIHSTGGRECRNPQTDRMAYLPAHIFDFATQRAGNLAG